MHVDSNHGHVENDESWHPVTKTLFDKMVRWGWGGAGTGVACVAPALHYTPYDGHHMAYVVWIVWGPYRVHTGGKSP
jgi:hypothetical protein